MRKRVPVLVCALIVSAAVAVAGCGSRADMTNSAGTAAAAVLRMPMIAVLRQQEEMVRRLEAGNVTGACTAYLTLSQAFDELLGPLSMHEPGLAREMADANTALKGLLNQKEPDSAQVGRQAQILVSALRRAGDGLGVSLTGTAAGQAGTVGAPVVTPAAAPATASATAPVAKTATPAATTAPGAVRKERTIEVRAREYRFTPATINVDKGTRVTIKLINEGTDKHEFELDAFRFEIRPIAPRTSAQASFVADRAGVFEFACHVDDHYEKGMKGTLVVK